MSDNNLHKPVQDFFVFAMSNQELADAITAAYKRSGTACEDMRIQQEHMKALLAIQLRRALLFPAEEKEIRKSALNTCPFCSSKEDGQ